MKLTFRAQIVGSTVLLVTAVIVLLIVGTQAVLEATAHRDTSRALAVRTDAAVEVLSHGGRRAAADLEPGARFYDAGGQVVAGTLERVASDRADELVQQALGDGAPHSGEASDGIHLLATPISSADGRGVVVVTQAAAPYERSERYALAATCALGLVVVGLAGWVTGRVTRKALAPVRQMAVRAADWSEHDLSHRFNLGSPTNELAALGETLDHLLDRVAAAIRGEQRLTAELAHELRTPLTAVHGSAELALMRAPDDPALREDLREIAAAAKRMSEAVTVLLELARTPANTRTAEQADMNRAIATVRSLLPERLQLTVDLPDDVPAVTASDDLVVRALAPLLQNAGQHARALVSLQVRALADQVEVAVSDDGGGIAAELAAHIFEPGASTGGGTGLGLGIARRVARSLGGEVELRTPASAEFVLTLPRAG